MKKVIIILFLFFLIICISCYYIYNKTEDKTKYITSIGDNIANINYLKNLEDISYDTTYVDKDNRLVDILTTITYNKENNLSIHQLLKKTDILIISIGMNDIYYKLDNNDKEIYTYLNEMIISYELLLKEINKYSYDQVYIIGYYNIYQNKNDIFTYINYKLNKLVNNYHYTYIDMAKIIKNNPHLLKNSHTFDLNNRGYYHIYQIIVEKLKKS